MLKPQITGFTTPELLKQPKEYQRNEFFNLASVIIQSSDYGCKECCGLVQWTAKVGGRFPPYTGLR